MGKREEGRVLYAVFYRHKEEVPPFRNGGGKRSAALIARGEKEDDISSCIEFPKGRCLPHSPQLGKKEKASMHHYKIRGEKACYSFLFTTRHPKAIPFSSKGRKRSSTIGERGGGEEEFRRHPA